VQFSKQKNKAVLDTVQDHKIIIEFLRMRNGDAAKSAMKIHIFYAMEELDM